VKVSGQKWYDNLWVKTTDFQVVGAITRFPVRQQSLRQSDGVIVFPAPGLLLSAVRTVPTVGAVLGAGEDGTGTHEVRLMKPVASCKFGSKVTQEEGNDERAVERKSLGPKSASETEKEEDIRSLTYRHQTRRSIASTCRL
jgi:hypothetical protein